MQHSRLKAFIVVFEKLIPDYEKNIPHTLTTEKKGTV